MKYYKDDQNQVYAYESDGSQDAYIKPGLTLITEQEMQALTSSVPQPITRFSSLDYLSKFTDTEYQAVRSGPMALQRGLDSLIAAQYVDLNDPRTAQYLSAMVVAGIIDEARKAELLTPQAAN